MYGASPYLRKHPLVFQMFHIELKVYDSEAQSTHSLARARSLILMCATCSKLHSCTLRPEDPWADVWDTWGVECAGVSQDTKVGCEHVRVYVC